METLNALLPDTCAGRGHGSLDRSLASPGPGSSRASSSGILGDASEQQSPAKPYKGTFANRTKRSIAAPKITFRHPSREVGLSDA